MVRVVRREESDDERLDRAVSDLARKHGLKLGRTGWTRKTYDLFEVSPARRSNLVARLETNALIGGEIRLFRDAGLAFAQELGECLERDFGIEEATILRLDPPD